VIGSSRNGAPIARLSGREERGPSDQPPRAPKRAASRTEKKTSTPGFEHPLRLGVVLVWPVECRLHSDLPSHQGSRAALRPAVQVGECACEPVHIVEIRLANQGQFLLGKEATIIAVEFSGPDEHSIRIISANREH
jgi:hypothetical protein